LLGVFVPTIKQVADQAGVSVATVSRVINKTGYVSLDLQERVVAAMRDLNYQPSALARSLRRQETQTVGVLVPQIDNPFFGTLAFAIEKTLFANQYYTFMCSAEESDEKEDAYVEMFLRQRVDGVILVPTGHSGLNLNRLLEQRVPVVLADRDVPGIMVSRVACDNQHGAYMATRHLLELGHRHIGVIGTPTYSEPMVQRLNGVKQAFADFKLDYNPELLVTGSLQQDEMGYTTALDMLRQPTPPTAIFALTDVIAAGVLHATAELGVSVPRDLSVVGFDNIPLAMYTIPELTTVAQPIYKMGETAAQMLLRLMIDEDTSLLKQQLETQLVLRRSTAAPREAHS
jgi:LacI family transcriptional regulator